MRLNSLRLQNFRQHVDTRIDFDTGITGIIGPNGSGKSTILEAVAWALYGMPAARGNRETVRSYRAGPKASVRVELDFELGGHRYRVERGLNSAALYLDGSASPIASSITTVSEQLHRRLGMSHDEFFNTYFTGQKELSVMAAMGPSERAQFLSRVLGYERLRSAQTLVRERRSAIVAESNGLRAGLPDRDLVLRAVTEAEGRDTAARKQATSAEARRTTARAAVDGIEPRWVRLQEEREASQALASEIRVAEADRASIERDFARVQRELDDTASARAELDALAAQLVALPALETELSQHERSHNDALRRGTLSDTVAALAAELAQLRERLAQIETAPALEIEGSKAITAAREEHDRVQTEAETRRTEWVRDAQEADTTLKALREQRNDIQKQREQIVELGENGICPICARPLDTHFRKVLDVLDEQLEGIAMNGRYYKSRTEQLATMPADLAALDERRRELAESLTKLERRHLKVQNAVQELAALVPEIAIKSDRHAALTAELSTLAGSYDAARHAEARRERDRLTPLSTRAGALSAQLDREPRLVAERDAARMRLDAADVMLVGLQQRRAASSFSDEAFGAMRIAYEGAALELRAAELAAVAADSELGSARAALDVALQARGDLEKNEARLAALAIDRRLHDELDQAYKDMRDDFNQALRPEIADRASRYLSELTDGRYTDFELDDDYNIIVLEDAIPKPVISGAEEDLANLVLRLSISEMIAERAGQAFSLLILDEVFGALDDAHRHSVMDLLRQLLNRFEQIIVITHIESLRELDRVLAVSYDATTGASHVDSISQSRDEFALDFQEGAAD